MQGKTRSFFEDTGIILLLISSIYGAYYLYDNATNDSSILLESNQSIKQDFDKVGIVEKSFLEKSFITVQNIFDDVIPLFKDEEVKISLAKNDTETLKAIDKKTLLTIKNEEESPKIEEKIILTEKDAESVKIVEQNIPFSVKEEDSAQIREEINPIVENVITEKETPIVVKIKEETTIAEPQNIKNEKNVDKNALRNFLRKLKFDIASNIEKNEVNDSSESQKLKLRITVLKDGNYEALHFVNGNKELFDKNKKNILKVFPLQISDSIVNDFPRYVRISIK